MTVYSLCARRDVGVRGSILTGSFFAGAALGVVLTQYSNTGFLIYLAISCLFVFIGMTFVAIDTQMMLKERRYGISSDDYVVAALMLPIDFINVFTHICSVVRKKKK
jgi:FtsH-binding integral membrane protein